MKKLLHSFYGFICNLRNDISSVFTIMRPDPKKNSRVIVVNNFHSFRDFTNNPKIPEFTAVHACIRAVLARCEYKIYLFRETSAKNIYSIA